MLNCHGYAHACTCPRCKRRASKLPELLSGDRKTQARIAVLQHLGFTYTGRDDEDRMYFEIGLDEVSP